MAALANRSGALMGLAPSTSTEVKALINRMIVSPEYKFIPDSTRAKIIDGFATINDGSIYSRKIVGTNTTLDFFEPQDAQTVGVRNVRNKQLDSGYFFLVTGMELLCATAAGTTDADLSEAEYDTLYGNSTFAPVANGELSVTIAGVRRLIRYSIRQFAHEGRALTNPGVVPLDNPFIIPPNQDIEVQYKGLTANGMTANEALHFAFLGTFLNV